MIAWVEGGGRSQPASRLSRGLLEFLVLISVREMRLMMKGCFLPYRKYKLTARTSSLCTYHAWYSYVHVRVRASVQTNTPSSPSTNSVSIDVEELYCHSRCIGIIYSSIFVFHLCRRPRWLREVVRAPIKTSFVGSSLAECILEKDFLLHKN